MLELAALHLAWMGGLCLPVGSEFRMAGRCLAETVACDGVTRELGIVIEV